MKPLRILLAAVFCLTAGAVGAQEYVTAKGKLSDEDFYRLVACAAPPGGSCQKRFVRWSKRDAQRLSIRVVQTDNGYPARVATKVSAMLEEILAEINGTGANLSLSLGPQGATPDIRIFLLDLPRTADVAGTGLPWFDGNPLQLARFQMGWRDDGTIIECAIALSRDVRIAEVRRVLIEEITQCLGFVTDIGGSYYETRSVFSETGNAANTLKPQDIKALRRHYP